ncbi:RNA-directed DNA polymerase [Desulfomicrobium macestii]|uniref:RNA-directed DNA polymerase n=1 Tax=Desulfomicrobium macestii TaxID=90731 RepID=A0ABR9H7V4_9BACT|nr:group II intron reverse transcriptase/maturase [Desulfomicrobium macestii]MBE1426783.1 RNA-directed DNA polymerase [Desulfomicrobium macestii]
MDVMEAVVERENMSAAAKRVRSNKGVPGVDGMRVEDVWGYYGPHIEKSLLDGSYEPQPVLGVEIPKPGGGTRQLGIPTAMDRLVQQALHQVLTPIFNPGFSESSYGFRPGRSAHQAVQKAREHVAAGKRFVVDMDLEKFFDRVNHDVLMARVRRKVGDKRVLGLIRRFLQAGLMTGGMCSQRSEGSPQGGPLSPLLSNILLDDLDKELERRGRAFCRYADDCNIYVRTRRSGERVMASVSRYLQTRLKLQVNATKSAVDRPWNRKFLGYSMTAHKQPRLKVAPAVVARLKDSVREVCRKGRGRSLQTVIDGLSLKRRGWVNYFKLSEVKNVFEELDGWIRRRLRLILWRQWKRWHTRAKKLMQRGLSEARSWKSATNGHGPWWNSGASHMNAALPKKYFDNLGLVSLLDHYRKLQCVITPSPKQLTF